MAIYNGRILMRRGLEEDFDASKLMSGEWALSTDEGIVRICLEAGTVIRMATYEAFEEDMKQIEAILLECQTIEEAVERINAEIDLKAQAVIEYAGQAKTYRDEALQFRNEAEAFKNQAGEIADIGIATTEKAGIVKPDGTSITVDADGTIHSIGGSGGTLNYDDLTNKPKINGVELNGNKTTADLGIKEGTTDYTELNNKPKINGVEITGELTTDDLNINAGTVDYTDLQNKPTINGVEITGNLTSSDLNIKAGGSMVEITVESDEEYNVEGLEVNLEIDGKTYTETIADKVVEFTGVLEVGKAVITCVDEAQKIDTSTSIDIPYYGVYETSIVLKSGGNYTEWIEAGGLNPSLYESLDALLEDEKAIRTLITKKDSVDVLAQMRGDDLTTIINHPYVAKWVNYREYAYSTLSAVSKIKTIMDASGMYGMYITVESDGTWQPKGLVPVMTSNTAPYGEVSASSIHSDGYAPYRAFDRVKDSRWISENNKITNQWLQYKFVVPTCVKSVTFASNPLNGLSTTKNYKIQASNDGNSFIDIYTGIAKESFDELRQDIENNNFYLYYRFYIVDVYGQSWTTLDHLQFYGRQLEALIPPMTSNTTPIGEVFASAYYNNMFPYYAFDCSTTTTVQSGWGSKNSANKLSIIGYKFNKPTLVKVFSTRVDYDERIFYPSKIVLQGLNSNSEWEDIQEYNPTNVSAGQLIFYTVDNPKVYQAVRMLCTETLVGNDYYAYFKSIQFYGTPDYESRTYIYDHGVEVIPLTVDNSNTALGTITKNNDNIRVAMTTTVASNGSPYCQLYGNEIDFTNYNCLCMEIDKELNQGTGTRFFIMAVTSNVPLKAGDSKVSELVITKPTNYIDVTSIQNKCYAVGFNNGTSAICTIASWWLE